MSETSFKDVLKGYRNLSFSDRAAFYYTVSNDIDVCDTSLQDFLTSTRLKEESSCVYCEGAHIVKNGKRKDGTQRYICRDCGKSFIPTSRSITSGTRKRLAVWTGYLRCMMDRKTLKEASEECGISVTTAFAWRHKILDALHELADKVYLEGNVEADETFFNVSYKGNHKNSRCFTMPREAHKRGSDVHTRGLSSEKVCVTCMISEAGISYARPAKLGKVSSECILHTFYGKVSPDAVLCTDREKAYISFAGSNGNRLTQTDPDCRITTDQGKEYGIQRINAYHRTLKDFIRGFHGVSTKHLGNYIVWNDLLGNHRRDREDTVRQLLGQILCARMTVRNRSISARAPLPCL